MFNHVSNEKRRNASGINLMKHVKWMRFEYPHTFVSNLSEIRFICNEIEIWTKLQQMHWYRLPQNYKYLIVICIVCTQLPMPCHVIQHYFSFFLINQILHFQLQNGRVETFWALRGLISSYLCCLHLGIRFVEIWKEEYL